MAFLYNFYTSRQAPRCGVDDKYFHDVAHNKSRQDEQRREGFSLSSAPTKRSFYENKNKTDRYVRLNCLHNHRTRAHLYRLR